MDTYVGAGLFFLVVVQILSPVHCRIQCNYCGIRKLCDLKYDPG
jgi:hypothetical protein